MVPSPIRFRTPDVDDREGHVRNEPRNTCTASKILVSMRCHVFSTSPQCSMCYHSNYERCVALCYVMLCCVMLCCMFISHAGCALACSVNPSSACWPFLARHSRGVKANIDLELQTHTATCSNIFTTQPPSWTTAPHPRVRTYAPINTPT